MSVTVPGVFAAVPPVASLATRSAVRAGAAFRPEIEGLRAVAVVPVAVHHVCSAGSPAASTSSLSWARATRRAATSRAPSASGTALPASAAYARTLAPMMEEGLLEATEW
ncbi:hypothetical protein BJF83_15270 [Nocardiopsis sp. CNR-923]|uniref:hypothetical protein n=1 Tax=Nocardiopsis sp. CNR-923 TaxID=1904965 RepID=UPI00095F3A8D|nr:hypothetical protein [Nocardiopsis sp. CNR-923]OLT28388.1 hypothetical protein BJF83_15270 [Nocardiopsis sp. CNR-923]